MRQYAAFAVGVAFLSSCGDQPGNGTLRINVSNLAVRAPFTELDLRVTRVELFYGTVPPDGDCDAPGQTLIVSPPFAVAVDLSKVGDSFVGEFSAPPGHISEVRLVSDSTHGVEQGLTRRAHPSTHCPGGDDTSGLFRLVPLPGQSIDVVAGDTTQIEVQLDPTRDITVDGQGGGYGQRANSTPGDSKPFKLASDYGVLAFVAAAAKDWRTSMLNTPLPHTGCFRAFYPSPVWQQVTCTTASGLPFAVGGTITGDFTAQTAGLISQAVGSFDSVTGLTTSDSTSTGGAGPFSLQLNTNRFATTACNGHAGCVGWEQFIFSDDTRPFNGPNAFIQYWLIGFGSGCPSGWDTRGSNCFRNSDAIGVPGQVASNLAQMTLVGKSTTTQDAVILSTTGGDLNAVGADNVVNLQPAWNIAEFNIFGNGAGSTAIFNTGSTIVVRTAITDGTANAPSCLQTSFTAEMNSLSLVLPCCLVAGAEPAVVFTESDVAGATSTCPVGACTPGVKVLADTLASSGPNCFGTSHDFDFGLATCDSGFTLGSCSAARISDDNGSTCTATQIGDCLCRVHVTTPADCFKSVDCHVLVTEQPIAPPVPLIVTNSTAHNGSDCFGTSHDYDFPAACDPGFTLGTCSTKLITSANGSTCTATPIGDCGCRVHVTTPADCLKFATCSILATEVPATWTAGCPSLVRF
jgi:hypothetical protein